MTKSEGNLVKLLQKVFPSLKTKAPNGATGIQVMDIKVSLFSPVPLEGEPKATGDIITMFGTTEALHALFSKEEIDKIVADIQVPAAQFAEAIGEAILAGMDSASSRMKDEDRQIEILTDILETLSSLKGGLKH